MDNNPIANVQKKNDSIPFLIESLIHSLSLFNWYWFKHETISQRMFHLFFYSCCCVFFLNTPNMTFHIICKLRNFGLAFKNLKILLEKGERNRGDPVMSQLQPLYSPIILCTILPTGNASELKTLTWVSFFTSITQNELGAPFASSGFTKPQGKCKLRNYRN